MKPTLSVVVAASNASNGEYYLKELIHSAVPVADEVVILNGDNILENHRGTDEVVREALHGLGEDMFKIKVYTNPWQPRMKKNMYWLQKSIAISHAKKDWVIRLDADEVLHEKDYDKILSLMSNPAYNHYDAFLFKTLHFWRDYEHIKTGANQVDGDNPFYERRPYMFRNNIGVWENLYDLVDVNGCNFQIMPKTSIEVFHYGHCRSKKAYVDKKNTIEKAYHSDWVDINEGDFEFDMSNTKKFTGTHPAAMSERIKT